METVGNQLEQQILEAEKETENLTRELAELDEIWNKNMALFEDNPAVKSAAAKADGKASARACSRCTRQVKETTGEGEDHASGKGRYRQVCDKKPAGAQVCCRQEPRQECRQQGCGCRAIGYVWQGSPSLPAISEDGSGNVISLAQRIRALQGDLGSKG
jgi:hypothetical protein